VRHAVKRGKALGINGLFGNLGISAAALIAGAITDLIGWRAAFIIPGVICLATGLALLACLRSGLIVETPPAPRSEAAAPSRGVVLRVYGVLLMTMLIMGVLFQATQVSVPKVFDLRLRDIAGEGALGIGAIVAAVYTVGSLTQVAGGIMADRLPLKPLYVGCFLLQIPVLAGIAVFGGLPLVTLVAATVFLTTAPLPAENMLLARYTPQRHHSLAYGVKFVLAFGTGPAAILLVSRVQAETGEFYWLYMALAAGAMLAALAALLLPGETSHRIAPAVAAE
jgi:predicted MFS family arabinose efflux permease